ncbi:MAG: ACT domain-containing protein [Clostridia bacterium]|nr:ACT domain-containing protein [Clostridia bacterium]
MNRTIITVIGKDRVGIIAKVCTYLAENGINILDINQSIVQGFFNMMMIVDAQNSEKDFSVLCEEIEKVGDELGVKIKMQHEDIFDVMHRI